MNKIIPLSNGQHLNYYYARDSHGSHCEYYMLHEGEKIIKWLSARDPELKKLLRKRTDDRRPKYIFKATCNRCDDVKLSLWFPSLDRCSSCCAVRFGLRDYVLIPYDEEVELE